MKLKTTHLESIARRRDQGEEMKAPMYLFFADDSQQAHPSRPGMGPLVAIGGIGVPTHQIRLIEREVNTICESYGFPDDEEFKWSPRRNQWMYNHLVHPERTQFFTEILEIFRDLDAFAIVVIEDREGRTATRADDHYEDATALLLERIHLQLQARETEGILIVDQPGGGRVREERYLQQLFEMRLNGTDFVRFETIAMNVVSMRSHFSRLLQVADIVTACTLARIAGQRRYTASVFDHVQPLLCKEQGRIGGVGVKIYPDRYSYLYHLLLGDEF